MAGGSQSTSGAATKTPRIDPQDPYRLLSGDSQLYPAGYYPGIQPLIVGESSQDGWYRSLIDQMVTYKVNLLRVALTMGMVLGNGAWRYPYRTGSGESYWPPKVPGHPVPKLDLDRFDDSYFAYWDHVLTFAASRGVVVEAAILDGFHTKVGYHRDTPPSAPLQVFGLDFDFFRGANNVNGLNVATTADWYSDPHVIARQLAFVEKMVETLAHHPNLIWETCNEPVEQYANQPLTQYGGRTWMRLIRDRIVAVEHRLGVPRHLIIPFDLPSHTQVAGHYVPSPGHDDLASYRETHEGLIADRQTWRQPLISDNDCCVEPGTPEQLRWKAWTALVSGGYGSMLVYNVAGGSPPGGLGLDSPVIQEGMRYVGLTRILIGAFGVELAGMVPADHLVSQPDPEHHPVWCLARQEAGREALLIYFIAGGSTVPTAPAGAEARWFDPTTGDVTPAQPDSAGSYATPSTQHDWVLYIAG